MTLCGVLYGHGRMGRMHASKLLARGDVRLAIIDPRLGLSPHPAKPPDFAVIATPTASHASVAMPLLSSGIPCLIEKPLAPSLALAEALAQHPHLAVGHIERFNPVLRALDGFELEFLQIERLADAPSRQPDIDVIDDLMIHDLDLLLHRVSADVLDVRAKGMSMSGGPLDMVSARVELRLASGRTAVANVTASRLSTATVRTWRAFAQGHYWSLDLHQRSGLHTPWGKPTVAVEVPEVDPLEAEHDAFLRAIREGTAFPCSGHDGLMAMQLADEIRRCLV